MMKRAFLAFFSSILVSAGGQVFVVDPDGGGDFDTIQEAVYAAWHGDTVLVLPGVYEEDVFYGGREITLTSADPEDPNVVASTVINGTIYFGLAETENARLEGFTILGGGFNATSDSYAQDQPALSWPYLIWQDQRNSNKDIFGLNLAANEPLTICIQSAIQEYPDIHAGLAVWQDNRSSNYDIYGKDLNTGDEIPICTQAALQNDPAVYDRIVVWRDFRNGNYDIYGKNLDTAEELTICTQAASQFNPDIYEDLVVWSDQRNSGTTGSDIYGKNLTSGQEFEICTAAGAQTRPAVWGSWVVWRDERNGNYDLYGKNLTSGPEFEICTLTAAQTFFDLGGDLVIWQDNRNGNEDIYGKYLPDGQEFVLCSASGNQTVPVTDGQHVAWLDGRTAIAEIYWYDLAYPACSRTISDGILCWYAQPLIRGCTIIGCTNYGINGAETSDPTLLDNSVLYSYGGIYGCGGLIENNIVSLNQIGLVECTGLIQNNTAAFNNVCGIAFCDGQILNSRIYRNHQAGLVDCPADIVNNTIVFNGGDGILDCNGLVKNNILAFNDGLGISGACTNRYNAFWDNTEGPVGSDVIPGIGSVLVDPLFTDIQTDNYHLLSSAGRWDEATGQWVTDSRTSRCIDGGEPNDSTQLELNPNGDRINLGAYGGTIQASKSPAGPGPTSPCVDPPSMDSNDDCRIDLTDLAAFCSQWLACGRDDPASCWSRE